MDKNTPTKVIEFTTYHSMGYSPSFTECPNCRKSILRTWEKPKECSYCGQTLLWNN